MEVPQAIISVGAARTVGIVLLTVPFIAFGGTFLLRIAQGGFPATAIQRAFFRAGHAHAGVLVTLGIVVRLAVDLAGVTGLAATLSNGVLWAAVLVPAGFFLSVTRRGAERPNGLMALLWLGVVALAIGVVSGGVGLLMV